MHHRTAVLGVTGTAYGTLQLDEDLYMLMYPYLPKEKKNRFSGIQGGGKP